MPLLPLHVDQYEMNYLILLQPTLNPRGSLWCDIVWMKKWGVGRKQLLVGSIVALRSEIMEHFISPEKMSVVDICLWCRSPTEPGSYMIKRVVATEGERVR